jgi:hypothetical protein
MEAFHLLKQTTTVNQYIDNFEDNMINVRCDHPYLTDHFFLLHFISGLKDSVKHMVKSHQPATLKAAYWHARQQEQAYLSFNKKTPTSLPIQRPNTTLPTRNTSFQREFKPRPPVDRAKDTKKCWYCPEPWSLGHKCQNVSNILHAINMQGHSDDEDATPTSEEFVDAVTDLPGPIMTPEIVTETPST